MNLNNESQVIQRIIEEYERRLQEQLALARQDIATELEQQIQVTCGVPHACGCTFTSLIASRFKLFATNNVVCHLQFALLCMISMLCDSPSIPYNSQSENYFRGLVQ